MNKPTYDLGIWCYKIVCVFCDTVLALRPDKNIDIISLLVYCPKCADFHRVKIMEKL